MGKMRRSLQDTWPETRPCPVIGSWDHECDDYLLGLAEVEDREALGLAEVSLVLWFSGFSGSRTRRLRGEMRRDGPCCRPPQGFCLGNGMLLNRWGLQTLNYDV